MEERRDSKESAKVREDRMEAGDQTTRTEKKAWDVGGGYRRHVG